MKQPSPSVLPAFKHVCRKPECIDMMKESCDKVLPCGHYCCGSRGESKCMPCLHPDCVEKLPEN